MKHKAISRHEDKHQRQAGQKRRSKDGTQGQEMRGMLWRGSPSFHEYIGRIAKLSGLTQSEYLAFAMLLGAILLDDKRPRRENIVDLFSEMNAALQLDRNILSTCTQLEWKTLAIFLDHMKAAGLVEGVTAVPVADCVSFTLRFTSEGRGVWRAVGGQLKRIVQTGLID